jgi:transglutaminase-like putative cysteine protease
LNARSWLWRLAAAAWLLAPWHGAQAENKQFDIGPAPAWVELLTLDDAVEAPADQVAAGVHFLLLDQQVRVDGRERVLYQHVAAKALNERGVESLANVDVRFDPSYQRLTLHAITVRRGGRTVARFNPAAVKLLQRETDLEALIFDGSMTASIFLADVRVGDVIDYAYSLRGHNPVFDQQHFGRFALQWSMPVARARARLLWPLDRPLSMRQHNGAAEPTVRVGTTHRDHLWDLRAVPARQVEGDAPTWFDPYPSVQWGEFADWQAVAKWAVPLYRLPLGAALAPVQAEAARMAAQSPDAGQRLLAALRFVQREVRYLGIETGPGSHAPSPPARVLERRFGDCKDKALLTVALLRALGMEADPALVNTTQQRGIESWLPSPGAFNHVVVRARLDGRELWLDPTRSLQKGSMATLAQADYGPALVVNERTDRLVPMAGEQALRHAREVRAVFDSREGLDKPVKYTVSSVARGAAADALRATLASQSREQMQKQYVNFYANYFAGVAVAAPLEVADDAAANAVTLTEHYVIDKFWQRSEAQKRLVAAIDAPELFDYLRRPRAQVRNSPLSLAHPTDLTHITEVRLPSSWPVNPDTARIDDPAFEFRREERWIDGRTLVLTDHFKSRLDHVAAADVGRYAANIEKARKAVNYELYWNDTPARKAAQPAPHWVPAVVGALGLLGCLALAWRVYRWDPPPWDDLAPTYPMPPSGLGGWLLLVALGVVVSIFRLARDMLGLLPSFTTDAWIAVATEGGSAYHPLWGPLLLFELVGNAAWLTGYGVLAVLFLQRRSSAPHVFIAVAVGGLLLTGLDLMLAGMIPKAAQSVSAKDWGGLVRQGLSAVIWTSYFLRSRRVRATFVERRSGRTPEPAPPLAPMPP